MYKELFIQVAGLVAKPRQAWQKLCADTDGGDGFLVKFVYPLNGMVAAAAFLGVFFAETPFSIEIALKMSIKALLSSLGGFFLSAMLLAELWKRFIRFEDNPALCRRFVGYSSVAVYSINIVLSFLQIIPLSQFFIMRVFLLFIATVYIVWEGAGTYLNIGETARLKFTLCITLLIVLMPELINRVLFMLMPGLRI
ncbi:MAG: hypothetical protein LBJ58_01665 [Tannerellaceae bacterium]|jgi:hypothetical protein|nr:hypothetical protein [Tannerellaceae bacterium]